LLSEDQALAVVEAGEKGFAAHGATGMLEQMLRAQEAASARQAARDYSLAQTCALLRENGKALQYLQLAFARHDIDLVVLTVDPCFAQIRNDPASQELVRRVGVARQPRST
jgi:nitroreductase